MAVRRSITLRVIPLVPSNVTGHSGLALLEEICETQMDPE